jgi:hypothetical protein
VLTPGSLQAALATYWDEMTRCRNSGAYWALLHITVCLPDLCAALQAANGKATGHRYVKWCNAYLPSSVLSGKERYHMRCKVLHQGRATTDQTSGRYAGFSFGQPSTQGHVDHLRVDAGCLNVDVGRLADEQQAGVVQWARTLEANPNSPDARHAFKNMSSLVQVRQRSFPIPMTAGISGMPQFVTTLKTS